MYRRSPSFLSPEEVDMNDLLNIGPHSGDYKLRPEAIESMFYMWRLTRDEKYREWAWEICRNIVRYSGVQFGFSSLSSIGLLRGSEKATSAIEQQTKVSYGNLQDSYFMAETLKYLFLIFSEDDVMSFDDWVLNTEAHLFRINKIKKL